MFRRVLCLGFMVFALVLFGCGSGGTEDKGTVTGTVAYRGAKLPVGIISFYESETVVGQGGISDGAYRVEKLPPGTLKVAIQVPPPAREKPPAGVPLAGPAITPIPIPAHYANPAKSGLSHTVTRGEQTKDFDLK